jgi:hypothetical protein
MSNNSGIPQTIINSLERAKSTDINSAQHKVAEHLAASVASLCNNAYNLGSFGDTDWGEIVPTANGTPLSADVISGLKVRPFSTYLLISAGVLGARATTTSYESSQDSNYVVINSPGVVSSAVLTFVANASSVRLDVIECSIVEEEQTQSVDILDPVTNTFTASLQPKTFNLALTFRVRQGTPGGGYPGHAAGWLPLAVAIHNGATASFAAVDFYDVRPLLAGRTSGPSRLAIDGHHGFFSRYLFSMNLASELDGAFSARNINGSNGRAGFYEARGRICPTAPGGGAAETNWLTLNSAHLTPGVPLVQVGSTYEFRYLLSTEPHDLPRWARYSTTVSAVTGEREPGDNWGLYFIVDNAHAVIDENGMETSFNTLPPNYGLTGQYASQFVAMWRQAGSLVGSATQPFFSRGNWAEFYAADTVVTAASPATITSATVFQFILPSVSTGLSGALPYMTSGFRVRVSFSVTPTSTVNASRLTARLFGGATPQSATLSKSIGPMNTSVAAAVSVEFEFTIPPDELRHPGSASSQVECELFLTGAGTVTATVSNIAFSILGVYVGR